MVNDVYTLLKGDHRKVENVLSQILDAYEPNEALFSQLMTMLEAHMEAEESFFYPAIEGNEDIRPLVLEAYEEHELCKQMLIDIDQLDLNDETWLPKLKVLKEVVEHHIEEEETDIFRESKRLLSADQEQTIAAQIQDTESDMGLPVETASE